MFRHGAADRREMLDPRMIPLIINQEYPIRRNAHFSGRLQCSGKQCHLRRQ